MEFFDSKENARKFAKSQLLNCPLHEISQQTINNILNWSIWHSAGSILFYDALQDEINLNVLLKQKQISKKYYLPLIKEDYLIFQEYKTNNLITHNCFDLIFVPALMFDQKGTRLGRGKGFYDRTFQNKTKEHAQSVFAGIIPESLYYKNNFKFADSWDLQVDFIITEKQIYALS